MNGNKTREIGQSSIDIILFYFYDFVFVENDLEQ
jgi:hypothetical protein